MEASSMIVERRIRQHAGFALVEILVELAVAGCRALARRMDVLARARRNALLRRELHGMSDHMLRDIGIERSHIDSLYR